MGANFAKRHKPVPGDEHTNFLTDPHEWYRHPAIRLFILFMVLFMDFFVYGQDPVQDSRVSTASLGLGQVSGLFAIWFAPNWQHKLLKLLCFIVSLVLAKCFGDLFQKFLIKVAKFGAFSQDGGTLVCRIIGFAPAAFLVDAIYNATLQPSDDELFIISSRSMEFFQDLFHLKSQSYQDMGKMWQWISATLDWLSIFMIGDSIFQDKKYWPGFMPGFKKWYLGACSGQFRVWFFRIGFPLFSFLTGMALNRTGNQPGQFNWELAFLRGTSEVTRSLCGAVIVFLDLLCLVQDWEFPLFSETHHEEEHRATFAGSDSNSVKIFGLTVTAKWMQYGPLLGIMGADFAFVKSMFQYTPTPYGQYVDPNTHQIWTIQNSSIVDVIFPHGTNVNSTLLEQVTYAARKLDGEPMPGCDTCPFDTESTAMFFNSRWDMVGAFLSAFILACFIVVARRANKTAIQEETAFWAGVQKDEKKKPLRSVAP